MKSDVFILHYVILRVRKPDNSRVVSGAHQLKVEKSIVRWERGWQFITLHNLSALLIIGVLEVYIMVSSLKNGLCKAQITKKLFTLSDSLSIKNPTYFQSKRIGNLSDFLQ